MLFRFIGEDLEVFDHLLTKVLFFSSLYLMVGVEASCILVVRLKTSPFETARLKYFLRALDF